MGSKKKTANKTELEKDAANASTSLVIATSGDIEEANKELLTRATNPQNAAALDAPTGITGLEAHSEEIKTQKKKKKKKKLVSGVQTVNAVVVEEAAAVETVNAPEKLEPAEAETGTVDMSDNVVLQKLLLTRATNPQNAAALDAPTGITGLEAHSEEIKTQKKKKKKKKKKKLVSGVQTVNAVVVEEAAAVETVNAPEKLEPAEAETGTVDMSDNVVLQKLLQVDPPADSGRGTCYDCGKNGHAAVNCTAAVRTKHCRVCGSLRHNANQCTVGCYCYKCKKVGHRTIHCPEKRRGGSKTSTICSKSWNSGHDMFSCKNDHSQDDLKAVIFEEEKETVETIEAPKKMEPAEAETVTVDMSDNIVLRKLPADIVEEEETVETIEAPEKMELAEAETLGMVNMSDNVVLQKLPAVIVEEENETVETVEAPEKMEPAEAETGMVDMSNNVVLQKLPAVIVEEENETVETVEAPEKMEPAEAETGMVDMSDNVVLRKLLRGPRYFDPPSDSGWGTCYNCGEEGHAAGNCTAAKRQKPCFVCGSLEHNIKKCPVGQYCHYCKGVGHQAKNCPVKQKGGSKSLTICLKCGNSGHDMFFCKNGYSQDDLKEMQCYVCKWFGHLCCVNTTDAIPREFSCYKCGQMGHTGLACSRLRTETTDSATPNSCYKCGEGGHFARECSSSVKASSSWQPESTVAATPSSCYKCGEGGHFARECSSSVKASSRWQTETTGAATPSSCYKCGEEGHFARECSSFVKVGKRKRELSTVKTPRFQKENDYMGYRFAPHDMGDRGFITPQKSNHRGGWMTQHRGEFSPSKFQRNSWRSPVTPCTKSTNIHSFNSGSHHSFNGGSYTPSPNSFKMRKVHYEIPNSGGAAKTYNLRSGNSSSNGLERSYGRW